MTEKTYAKVDYDIQERIQAINRLLKDFIKYHSDKDLTTPDKDIESTAERVALLYHEYAYSQVKPFLVRRIDRHKMASMTMIMVIYYQPIRFISSTEIDNKTRRINAELAYMVFLSLLISMPSVDDHNRKGMNLFEDAHTKKLKNTIIKWLTYKSRYTIPVYELGMILYLLSRYYIDKNNGETI